ncbi:MAG: hypothetical protein KC621_28930 [Myxococcales bacterium]|nr:hypothetical protein [Myxococcales bacterium]
MRLGAAAALWPDKDVMPMGNVFAEARVRQGRGYLAIAPGLYLSGPSGDLDYGGLALELGGGWMLSERPVAPYLGGGIAGRLQFSDDDGAVGFAPYGQLGLQGEVGTVRAFGELRVYQNVLPIAAGADDVFPFEPGIAVGVLF